ncbi:MAG: nucleotidyltransferase domain-containing protein [Coriobacteriales bacterium]|nr:nucleotidyltransferase domain-containing protein [Coriobacteriales bacterium]
MRYTYPEIRSRIAPVAEKYGIPAVYLFGSYARDEANDDSDIDIIYERRRPTARAPQPLPHFVCNGCPLV